MIDITIDPVLGQVGPFQLGWHGIFTGLAIVAAIWFGLWRAERRGLPTARIADGVVWAILGGLLGARLFHVLDHLSFYLQRPLEALAIWQGGMAVYGGFVGGIVTAIVLTRAWKLPTWPVLDAAGPAMLLGQAVGRIGCLINGDAWGAPTDCPCGVRYWHPQAALPAELLGVPTHPYPLYEIGADLVLLGGLLLLGRRLAPGSTFLLATVGYAVIRFSLTVFRQEPILLWGLQEAQIVALATGAIALVILLPRARRAAVPAAPGAAEQDGSAAYVPRA